MRYPQLLKIANKPAAQVTDAEIAVAVEVLSKDPRVAYIAGPVSKLRHLGPIVAVISSEIEGDFSIGRVIGALNEMPEEIALRKARTGVAVQRERERASAARIADLHRRSDNTRRLNDPGFSVADLDRAWMTMSSGRYLDAETRHGRASAWHSANVSGNHKLSEHYIF